METDCVSCGASWLHCSSLSLPWSASGNRRICDCLWSGNFRIRSCYGTALGHTLFRSASLYILHYHHLCYRVILLYSSQNIYWVFHVKFCIMDMSSGSTNSTMQTMMVPWLHFTGGDNLFFKSIHPSSKGAIAGACIVLVVLALFERWVAAMRGVLEATWRRR